MLRAVRAARSPRSIAPAQLSQIRPALSVAEPQAEQRSSPTRMPRPTSRERTCPSGLVAEDHPDVRGRGDCDHGGMSDALEVIPDGPIAANGLGLRPRRA